jgi:SPX domain protein involved in polyphosphate accumulation
LSKYEVECIVKLNAAIFSEIYHQRFVNNIYFDSFNLANYRENIEGATDRIKIRIRWYGELFGYMEKPVLEIKIKKEFLNKKISIPIKPFVLKKDTKISDILNSFTYLQDSLAIDFNSIQPSLLNQYTRKYYQSCNGHFRITIDTDQSFYQVNKQNNYFLNRTTDKNTVILELKYAQEHESRANHITTKFPFRITKSSKYINGVENILQAAF